METIILPANSTGSPEITRIECFPEKSLTRNKTLDIIFCLPGNNFSGKFLQSWTRLLIHCMNHGINADILQMYSSNVYHVRESFLSMTVLSDTKNIRPFGGRKYDYSMWIDSDQTFTPDDLERLIARDKDIVSGAIKVNKDDEYAFGWVDDELMREKGELKRWKGKDLEGRRELIEVDFCGLAFSLVKFGVFESLKFPYFEPVPYSVYPACKDKYGFMGEDLSIFYRLKQKGYKIYIDPTVRVGHEKSVILI